jgi:hypothetical protein
MKPPKRFALSTLLLVMFLVSLVCGFIQWRRLRLIDEVEKLNAIGGRTFSIAVGEVPTFNTIQRSGGWWPTVKPQPITVNVKFDDFGKCVVVGGSKYSVNEAKQIVADLRHRLTALGITDVTIHVTDTIYNFDAAEELEAVQ